MTSAARINGEIRMVAAGLVANDAAIRPGVITATGRAAPSQVAIVPGSFPASFALLPHVDYDDVPELRPGGGFVGGRISSIVPYLAPGAISAADDVRVTLKQLPASLDAIRQRLRWEAGLWWAPGAIFSLVGWEDERIYVWLDQLRQNGSDARLSIALSQAHYAVRRMWARVAHDAGAPPTNLVGWWPSLTTQCGAVAVGRALLDVAAMLFRLIEAERSSDRNIAAVASPMRKIGTLIRQFVHHVERTDGRAEPATRRKLMNAVRVARKLLEAVAVFSVADDPFPLRWRRLDAELEGPSYVTTAPFTCADLAVIEARLNRLAAADLGDRLERTVWQSPARRSLLRLASADSTMRLVWLDRIRTDLLYMLAMTGRLDRLYTLFPWLAAPHGGFVNCAGGALGALAMLIECGRRLAIAREQKRELGDALSEELLAFYPSAIERLTVPVARAFWRSEVRMAAATGHGHVASIALEHGAFSHATVTAMMNGTPFAPAYPLTAARFGRLGWSLPAALRDPRTVAAVRAVEQGRQVMGSKDHDDDLPRCNGMTLRRQLAETIVWAFPTGPAGKSGPGRRSRAVAAADRADRPGDGVHLSVRGATNEILRSMLLSLDIPPDDIHRDAIADNVVPSTLLTGEAARADLQQTGATRKSVDCEVGDAGQGIRNQAVNERSMTDDRYALLRKLAWDVAHWHEPKGEAAAGLSKGDLFGDDLLDAILRGRADLGQLTPVGALPLPLLWFAPLIDRERLRWIANGASIAHAPSGPAAQAEGIALAVARAHAWAPLLYARTLLTGRSVDIACALFTGRSPVTADLELAYSVR